MVRFNGPYGEALAFDYGNEELRRVRVQRLLDELQENGYTGVFFDWFASACSEEWASNVPGYVEEFRRRHPNMTLWNALRAFLVELREEAARRGIDLLIVSNQAYRCGPEPMEYVDWDISEAYFTDVTDGGTEMFEWNPSSWDSPALYVPALVVDNYEQARRENFRLGFFHLSYASPQDKSREAAFYAFAGARVFGHDGMAVSPWGVDEEVSPDGVPNIYWLGCWRGSTFDRAWAAGVYDLGLVAVGQGSAKVPPELAGRLVVDLFEQEVLELPGVLDYGGEPWGRVFLLLADRYIKVECGSWNATIPVYGNVTEGALEALAGVGGCHLSEADVGVEEAVALWSFWREPVREVSILANDIDWNLSGGILEDALRRAGIEVSRVPLNFSGVREALLDSKAVIVLGGPKSPVLGEILKPLTSRLEGPGICDLGPGRILLWLWGEDRYATKDYVVDHMDFALESVKDVLSPIPRCHQSSNRVESFSSSPAVRSFSQSLMSLSQQASHSSEASHKLALGDRGHAIKLIIGLAPFVTYLTLYLFRRMWKKEPRGMK